MPQINILEPILLYEIIELSINDWFHEIFDENQRLIQEFSLNKRYVEVLQKYRHLLTTICSESEFTEELRQIFTELEDEYKTVDKEINTIITETGRKSTELRNQMNTESEVKDKRLMRSTAYREVAKEEEEYMSAEDVKEDNEDESESKTNVRFLSATDRLLEEDGLVITERDAKNPLILGLNQKF